MWEAHKHVTDNVQFVAGCWCWWPSKEHTASISRVKMSMMKVQLDDTMLDPEDEPLWSFKLLQTIHPVTQHNIHDNSYFQQRFFQTHMRWTPLYPKSSSLQPRKWSQHVSPKHWQHTPLSHGVNTPKENQHVQKQILHISLVYVRYKTRLLERKYSANNFSVLTLLKLGYQYISKCLQTVWL